MNRRPKVIIYGSHDGDPDLVSELTHRFDFIFEPRPIQEVSRIVDASVVVLFADSKFEEHHITPSLESVICRSTGVDNVVCKDSLKARGIKITRGETYATQAVAEYLLACCLDSIYTRYLKNPQRGRPELADKKIIVFGTGSIGRRFFSFIKAIGADGRLVSRDHPSGYELDILLAQADIITVNTNLREDNYLLFDSEFFCKVKPGAVFINVSRGELVENSALLWALNNKMIEEAYLDVLTEDEFTIPLKKHPRVHCTLHTAWKSPSSLNRSKDYFLSTLRSLVRAS